MEREPLMHCEDDGKNIYKTLMALFPKSKVLKGLVSRSGRTACAGAFGGSGLGLGLWQRTREALVRFLVCPAFFIFSY